MKNEPGKIRLVIVALIAAIPPFNASASHIYFTNATINGVALETSNGLANPAITVQPNAPIIFRFQAHNTSAGPTGSDTLAVTFAASSGNLAAPTNATLFYPGGSTYASPYSMSFTQSYASSGIYVGSLTADFPVGFPDYVIPGTTNAVDTRTFPFTIQVCSGVCPFADLVLSMSDSPDPVVADNSLTYTLTILNNGPTNASAVTVTNFLPASVTVVSAIASQGTCTNLGSNIVCNLGPLASNATATVILTVVPDQAGSITNVASVAMPELDFNTNNNTALAVTTVQPAPPFIYNVAALVRPTSAIITWATRSNATSQVEYGLTTNYDSLSPFNASARKNHAVLLMGLLSDTNYFFRAISRVGIKEYRSTNNSFSTDVNLIVDNPQARYSGNWTLGTSSSDQFGSSYQSAQTSTSPSPSAHATYAPVISAAAKYDVYIWHPAGPNRTTNAQVTIFFDGGSALQSINQTINGGGWRLLAAELDFAAGTDGFATIGNNTGESGKVVMADAMRWSYSAGQESPPDGSLPAWWMNFYFGAEVDTSVDHDGDGYSTHDEFVLATDPTNATSRLEFRAERSGSGLTISFSPSQGGRVYQLASTTNLTGGVWTVLPDVPTAIGNEGSFIISSTATPARRYFRLQVHLSP